MAARTLVALLLLALLPSIARACHPECRWACDDPVCTAVCEPVCDAPVCQVQCDNPADVSACRAPHCWVRCPEDMCENEHCPACETVCAPLDCSRNPEAVCSALCEETRCAWWCEKPTDCAAPRCELHCERPACESTHPPTKDSDDDKATVITLSIVLPLLAVILCVGFMAAANQRRTPRRQQ